MPKITKGRNTSIIRILSVYKILANERSRGASIKEILEKVDCECSERTIRRDVDVLSNLFPIDEVKEENITYFKFSEKQNTVSIPMTDLEVMSLFVAKKILEDFDGLELYESFNTLTKKIEKSFPLNLIRFFKSLDDVIVTQRSNKSDFHAFSGYVDKIQNAILHNKQIEFNYISGFKKEKTHRTVDPYLIWLSEGMIYLIGFCHLRNEVRSFLIYRITNLETKANSFVVDKNFNVDEYTNSGIGVYSGKPQNILLKFSDKYFDYINKKKWHKSQTVFEKNNEYFMSLKVAITPELENFILGFGEHCEVIEPLVLREDIKTRLVKTAEQYKKFLKAA